MSEAPDSTTEPTADEPTAIGTVPRDLLDPTAIDVAEATEDSTAAEAVEAKEPQPEVAPSPKRSASSGRLLNYWQKFSSIMDSSAPTEEPQSDAGADSQVETHAKAEVESTSEGPIDAMADGKTDEGTVAKTETLMDEDIKETAHELVAEELIVVPNVSWWILKEDKRKCLATGVLQIVTDPLHEHRAILMIKSQQELDDEKTLVADAEACAVVAEALGVEDDDEEEEEAADGVGEDKLAASSSAKSSSSLSSRLLKAGGATVGAVKSAVMDSSYSKGRTYELSTAQLCMRVFDRHYVFSGEHQFFGLIVDMHLRSELVNYLESVLSRFVRLKQVSRSMHRPITSYPSDKALYLGPTDRVAQAGESLAKMIRNGTVKLVRGIRYGAEKATSGIASTGTLLKSKIEPNSEPTQVSASIQSKLVKAKLAGTGAVAVTGALVTGAMAAKEAIAQELSESMKGGDISSLSPTASAEASSGRSKLGPKTRAAKEIAKSVMHSAVTVVDEAVSAAIHVVGVTSSTAADVVGHKYGAEVRQSAETCSDIVVATSQAAANWNQLGVKTLGKRLVADVLDSDSDEEQETALRDAVGGVAEDTLGASFEDEGGDLTKSKSGPLEIDPITGLQALTVVAKLDAIGSKHKSAKKRKRQEKMGLEPHTYKSLEELSATLAVEAPAVEAADGSAAIGLGPDSEFVAVSSSGIGSAAGSGEDVTVQPSAAWGGDETTFSLVSSAEAEAGSSVKTSPPEDDTGLDLSLD